MLNGKYQAGMSPPPEQCSRANRPGLLAETTGLAPHPFARMTDVDLMKADSDTRLLNVIWAAHAFGFLVSRIYTNE